MYNFYKFIKQFIQVYYKILFVCVTVSQEFLRQNIGLGAVWEIHNIHYNVHVTPFWQSNLIFQYYDTVDVKLYIYSYCSSTLKMTIQKNFSKLTY